MGENVLLSKIKEAIRATYARQGYLREFSEILRPLQNEENEEVIKFNIFSDNFVFSLEAGDNHFVSALRLANLLSHTASFQRYLSVEHGLFLRGAIAKGTFYRDQDFVFGQALIDAYQAESKSSIYPRILVLPSCLELLVNCDFDAYKEYRIDFYESFLTAIRYVENTANEAVREEALKVLRRVVHTNAKDFSLYLPYGQFTSKDIEDVKNLITTAKTNNSLWEDKNTIEKLRKMIIRVTEIEAEKMQESVEISVAAWLDRSDDGQTFVNYINVPPEREDYHIIACRLALLSEEEKAKFPIVSPGARKKRAMSDLSTHQKCVKERLIQHQNNEMVFAKYNWLANYHNRICVRNGVSHLQIDHPQVFTYNPEEC